MKDELIKVIAEYLEAETIHQNGLGRGEWIEFGGKLNPAGITHAGFCQEIAAEIAGKVLEVVEKKTSPTKLEKNSLPINVKHIFHKGVDLYQCIVNYELGVISKDQFILEVQAIDSKWATQQKTGWEDAPEWAKYRTVDKDGTVVYWDQEPYLDEGSEAWRHLDLKVRFFAISNHYQGWEKTLEKRP